MYTMYKSCTKCNKQLHIDKFHKLSKGKYGRHPKCKSCRKNNVTKYNKKTLNIKTLTCNCCGEIKNSSKFYKKTVILASKVIVKYVKKNQ